MCKFQLAGSIQYHIRVLFGTDLCYNYRAAAAVCPTFRREHYHLTVVWIGLKRVRVKIKRGLNYSIVSLDT